ncbi:VPLPA-CTERM sorting domain-containing protein [Methylomonas sp. EFPC3]|uniref:VPLPA-CTERM sorting domain-containing protein n=1 Tax=Methylomonas sp. EFPC3 TaxID=3021710 RepID=UPI0024161F4D|nr:VPLPA-CTERM sorting domain-containing protein [Methylomonas sp. EFPC3]WFP48567.1 VPLPA-CTERM sorting domain-containing protein [Methylomonas sp. EFPC3]
MKQNSKLKRLACFALSVGAMELSHADAIGFDPSHQVVGGRAYLTFDQAALATLAPRIGRYDDHGMPIDPGTTYPTADAAGQRLLYVRQYLDSYTYPGIKDPSLASDLRIANGTADPEAVAQWRLLTPEDRVPIQSPEGGWDMPIDPLSRNFYNNSYFGSEFGSYGYTPSAYDPDPNSTNPMFISIGGNFQFASDFISPTGSIWMRGLGISLEQQYYDSANPDAVLQNKWYLVSDSDAYNPGAGRWFELKNPVFGTNEDGMLTLDSDIMLGDAMMGVLIHNYGDTKTIGHLTFNLPNTAGVVAPVPLPATAWLFGSALFGLVGFRRRTDLS